MLKHKKCRKYIQINKKMCSELKRVKNKSDLFVTYSQLSFQTAKWHNIKNVKQFNFENQLVSLFPKINVVTENQVITVNQQTN